MFELSSYVLIDSGDMHLLRLWPASCSELPRAFILIRSHKAVVAVAQRNTIQKSAAAESDNRYLNAAGFPYPAQLQLNVRK